MFTSRFLKPVMLTTWMLVAGGVQAVDVVKFSQGMSLYDTRATHKKELMHEVLEATKEEFGPYEFNLVYPPMTLQRALAELTEGELINTHMAVLHAPSYPDAIVIRVPIMRGLMSYRLIMVNEKNKDAFAAIQSIDDLKKWRVGSLKHWSLTKVLSENGFNVVQAENYETLFKMLSTNRFDYLLRGVNEVFSEMEAENLVPSNVVVAPNIAVFIPMPQYLFVSPKAPELAKRLEVGMHRVVENGKLKELNSKYHRVNLEKADLANRRMLTLSNPNLGPEDLAVKKYWIHFDNDK